MGQEARTRLEDYDQQQQDILRAGWSLFDISLRRIRLVDGELSDNVRTATGVEAGTAEDVIDGFFS